MKRYRLRRLVDILVALGGLLLSTPIFVVASLAIVSTMGLPIFFAQERAGRLGQPFRMIKFRTMRKLAAGEQEFRHDAVRITRLGRILRTSSLDELPTLWNVLVGQMSIVGPRPLPIQYLSRYSRDQLRRHDVAPGITGWAQVNGRNALTWDQKLEMDLWYVKNRNFGLDLKILVRTVGQVILRRGIGHGDHVTMPEFLGEGSPTEPQ